MQNGEVRNPFLVYILTFVTCGIYGLYWVFTTSEELNAALGREEFNPGMEVGLGVITCGLWILWWDWRASEASVEIQQNWGVEPKFDAPIVFIITWFFFGVGIQMSLNNAWENGAPQGGQGVV